MPTRIQLVVTSAVLVLLTVLLGYCNRQREKREHAAQLEAEKSQRMAAEAESASEAVRRAQPSSRALTKNEKWKRWSTHMLDLLDVRGTITGDAEAAVLKVEGDVSDKQWDTLVETFRDHWKGSGELIIMSQTRKAVTIR